MLRPLNGQELEALGIKLEARRFALWLQALWGLRGWTFTGAEALAVEWGATARTVRRWEDQLVAAGAWGKVVKAGAWRALVFLRAGQAVGELGANPGQVLNIQRGSIRGQDLLRAALAGGGSAAKAGQFGSPPGLPSLLTLDTQVSGDPGHPGVRGPAADPGHPGVLGVSPTLDTQVSGDPGHPGVHRLKETYQQQLAASLVPATDQAGPPAAVAADLQPAPSSDAGAARQAVDALAGLGIDQAGRWRMLPALAAEAARRSLGLPELARLAVRWAEGQGNPGGALWRALGLDGQEAYLGAVLERFERLELLERKAGERAAELAKAPGNGSPSVPEDPLQRAWDTGLEGAALELFEARRRLRALEGQAGGAAGIARARIEGRLASMRTNLRNLVRGAGAGAGLGSVLEAFGRQVEEAPATVRTQHREGLAGWRAAQANGSLETLAAWLRAFEAPELQEVVA